MFTYPIFGGGGGGGPLEIIAVGSATTEVSTANLTVPLPSGVTAGDLLLVLVINDLENDSFPLSISTPSGYTKITEVGSSASDARAAAFWKIAGSSETVDPIVSVGATARIIGTCLLLRGQDPVAPIGSTNSTIMSASTSHVLPGITTTEDGSLVVGVFSFDGVYSNNLTFVGGNDWVLNHYLVITPLAVTAGAQGMVYSKSMPVAGTTGTCTINSRSDTGVGLNIIIEPA